MHSNLLVRLPIRDMGLTTHTVSGFNMSQRAGPFLTPSQLTALVTDCCAIVAAIGADLCLGSADAAANAPMLSPVIRFRMSSEGSPVNLGVIDKPCVCVSGRAGCLGPWNRNAQLILPDLSYDDPRNMGQLPPGLCRLELFGRSY
ncbi:hypothetical protein G7Z17_g7185 [Cylindrodendrum hubeiense]|uniref:Uncharacterized protein n=1 Tax=Cylindrodendrum hubeiense TaxID=595255 RepID=A0A9P5H8D9_9HYPO|nr:hypothetical protein G7Z17_g7185 [Cylindrodendrum hubeiense]